MNHQFTVNGSVAQSLLTDLAEYLTLQPFEYRFWQYKKASNRNKSTLEINYTNLVTIALSEAGSEASVAFEDAREDSIDVYHFDGTSHGLIAAYEQAFEDGYRLLLM